MKAVVWCPISHNTHSFAYYTHYFDFLLQMQITTPPTRCPDQRVVVTIDGNPIPTTRVETEMSLDGVANKNIYADVTFPTTWRNEDIIGGISAFGDVSTPYSQANVYYQDPNMDTWALVLDGYVRSVGGTNTSGTARLIIGGWEQFFSAIPFSGSYDDPTISTIISDVTSTFAEQTPISLSTAGVSEGQTVDSGVPDGHPVHTVIGGGAAITYEAASYLGIIEQNENSITEEALQLTKHFKKNRNTLKDVMEWLCEQIDARWYVDTTGDGPVLVLDQENNSKHFFDATLGAPGVRVIENDAIQEIVPVNSIRVKGKSATSIMGVNIKELPSNEYPMAEAEYDPLVERANGNLKQPIVEKDTITVDATKQAAKKELRNKIQGAVNGDIKAWGKPDIEPLDRFTGVPVCSEHHVGSTDPIEYEVQSVQHIKESGSEYVTRIGVRVWVDPDTISVTGTMEET